MKPFTPTYLYVKTHTITGLKYFGKTTKDPFKYLGSGLYWLRHIRKYGTSITTEIIGLYYSREDIKKVADSFSIEHDIVDSVGWANCKVENGLDGGFDFNSLPLDRQQQLRQINKQSGSKGAMCAQQSNLIRYGTKSTLSWLNSDPSFIEKRDNKPDGHQKGEKNSQFGTLWITNGIENKKIKKSDSMPDGWTRGRKSNKIK